RSDTVLFDVELDSCSTSCPTGSPTPAYLRVDTPASIRFITTTVSDRDPRSSRTSRPAAPARHRPSGPAAGGPAPAGRPTSSTQPHDRGAWRSDPGSSGPSGHHPVDLGLHQLVHDAQPHADAQREQSL